MGEDKTGLVVRKTEGALDFGTVSEAMQFAQLLCKSNLVPESIRDKPADVMIVMMTGRALGIDSITALRQIHVIKGRTTMDASLLRALAMRHPQCEYLTMVEDGSSGRSTWETMRTGQPKPVRITWTREDAKRAGLLGKDNWKNYEPAMLRARASADLVRAVYPEVGAGLYTPEEVADFQGEIVEVTADPVLRPERKAAAPTQPEPPATDRQRAQIGVLATYLGAETVATMKAQAKIGEAMSEAQAAMLIDALRAEADARDAPPAKTQPAQPATAPVSPGAAPEVVPAEQQAGLWPEGRE